MPQIKRTNVNITNNSTCMLSSFILKVSAAAIKIKSASDFESAKKTCEEENATLGIPEEPEHTLHVPVWINLVKKVQTSWKADGGSNKSKSVIICDFLKLVDFFIIKYGSILGIARKSCFTG